jgi:hypothetical protein
VCFSADADLVAGLTIGAIGIDALRHVRRPIDVPLASLPMVFAVHSLIEAFVWWGLNDRVGATAYRTALWAYLIIAFVVVPILVPIAVTILEPPTRRTRMHIFVVIGVLVAGALVFSMLHAPINASIQGHHIEYSVKVLTGGLMVGFYVLATCGSLLSSQHRRVRWFGVTNLIAAVYLAWLSESGFVSLWCVWAGITSIVIAVDLRLADRLSEPATNLC